MTPSEIRAIAERVLDPDAPGGYGDSKHLARSCLRLMRQLDIALERLETYCMGSDPCNACNTREQIRSMEGGE